MSSMSTPAGVIPRDVDDRTRSDWTLPEEPVPESILHAAVVDLLKAVLMHWVASAKIDALVASNLAVRWLQGAPRVGLDPDLCLVVPRPPDAAELESLRTWMPGQAAPALAVEVVSQGHPYKDYADAPVRYAAAGARELWVFDPLLAGPRALGGPTRLQVWTRAADGSLARAHAGEGPAFSPALGAWVQVVDAGSRLRVSDDEAGRRLWPTAAEAERAAKEAALARVAELEAELARRR
jgi:Uma2 family endonuclease